MTSESHHILIREMTTGSAVGGTYSRRSVANDGAGGDERWGGIFPRVPSGPGEITSDVIGSSVFCNGEQKG